MEMGKKWPVNLACDSNFHVNRRDLLHTTDLRHGTDGFTSPPKEGMLWIFSLKKSDDFGRVQTHDLGYQMPLKPLYIYILAFSFYILNIILSHISH
jgi:hypothetical protein